MESSAIRPATGQDQGNTTTVAFLGPLYSYSHQATKIAFPDDKWQLEPTTTIKEVFDRVQAGHAPYGVVPFENSTHGTVTFTLDCLADRAGEYPDICVCGEVYLDVHHFLLGRLPPPSDPRSRSQSHPPPSSPPSSSSLSSTPAPAFDGKEEEKGVPLASLAHIRRVYSHPQAFGQTAAFFRRYLSAGGVELIDVSSTSRAARLAAEDASGASAAVASEWAGRAAGLDVLARSVEDREDNATRFFVLRRRGRRTGDRRGQGDAVAGEGGEGGGEGGEGEGEGVRGGGERRGQEGGSGGGDPYGGEKYKSLVSFTVPHRRPGALADVLDCFRGRALNLTSINSLPSLVGPFQYLFFVEFEGSRFDDPEGRVSGVFGDLERAAERWRWLGSWRNRRGEAA